MEVTKTRLALFIVALAAVMLFPGVAYANFAIHGGYLTDTDACAGCHRAHTSVSSITWTDNYDGTTQHSALLVSSATSIYQFCYACHGADAQGADTNVEQGVYEGSLYGTNGGTLNGGGFETVDGTRTTSTHVYTSAAWGAWGGGTIGMATATAYVPTSAVDDGNWFFNTGKTRLNIVMDCATCHDPHGSSNYRILKDMVYGNRVGGYWPAAATDPTPTPWVTSVETGYPDGGWRLHNTGAAQVAAYVPNYTTAMYAKATTQTNSDVTNVLASNKGMSGWCSGCHAVYNTKESTYNANDLRVANGDDPLFNPTRLRHRHPMNVPLSNFHGQRDIIATSNPLPLEHDTTEKGALMVNRITDNIGCLTCHRAHGTSAIMTGYADSGSNLNPSPDSNPSGNGVPPSDSSALLRGKNRYVCEVCHNK